MRLKKVKAFLIGMAGIAGIIGIGAVSALEKESGEAVSVMEETGTEAAPETALVAGISGAAREALSDYGQAKIAKNELEKTKEAADVQEKEDERELTQEETEAEIEMETEAEQEAAPELVIASVDHYVNIRDRAGMEGEVIGKLYDHSVGTLLEEAEGGWYRIESGSVDGYVKAEYVLRGEEGQALADAVGKRLATVTTVTLKVRMEPNTESKVLGLVPLGDTLTVSEETEGWVRVSVEEGEGYVSTEYVDVYTENVKAESKQEEEARLAREEEERRQAKEAAERELARQQEEARRQEAEAVRQRQERQSRATQARTQTAGTQASSGSAVAGGAGNTEVSKQTQTPTEQPKPTQNTVSSGSDLGSSIASYGLQFVGNPYVYGGTSLTNGTDCSGFVQSVYAHFGISLPRTSGEQGRCGSAVAGIEQALPGDLVWYSGHIGIYIGNGQIVHASNPSSGIKVSSATYRTILSIRRIV